MPRPLHDLKQPQIGPSAGDLGRSAYAASVQNSARPEAGPQGRTTVRPWEAPEPLNPPPGQKRRPNPALGLGSEVRD